MSIPRKYPENRRISTNHRSSTRQPPDDTGAAGKLNESFSILFLVMAQYPELHLVPNHCGIWSNSVDKEGGRGVVWADLEVPAGIDRKDHVQNCRVDEHMAYID
ncbi:conserved hypothetical protein [Trichinella spiralis]|uniref:hypothetical protein n=1 Tax=Trichinella spiralis TaxID=6334 RepID=UPI0001EFB5BC|nr:conserved hypothetical protein [Trichinella spiralis]